MKYLKAAISFISRHRFFTLFFIACLMLNIFLLVHKVKSKMDFITCSTFDKGLLGTFAFFEDMSQTGLPVRRLQLSPFRNLNPDKDRGKTLIILSPRFSINVWEWDKIFSWTAQGNRLITAGLFGPKSHWWDKKKFQISYSQEAPSPVKVALPIDSVFPYPEELAALPQVKPFFFFHKAYKDTETVFIRYFDSFSSDMLPLLVYRDKPIAAKKAVGKGEWVVFTLTNPFSNTLLQDETWYRFAARLLTGNPDYQAALYFDEYHNGYKATKNLWELLSYYQFTDGIIFLCLLILLLVFFNGVRIIPPVALYKKPQRDMVPGLQAMSKLLFRYQAWDDILIKEREIMKAELLGSQKEKENESRELVELYLKKHPLPVEVGDKQELIDCIESITHNQPTNKKNVLKTFNTLVSMRKELLP